MNTADELAKLDALRKSGVLTQEEFDAEKSKLLAAPLLSPEAVQERVTSPDQKDRRNPGGNDVWARICACEEEVFYQKRGQPFTYSVMGSSLLPSTTNRMLSRSQFEEALTRLPVSGPGGLNDLQGPSYLYAILTDPRVAGSI
jgi:hypothetical protein